MKTEQMYFDKAMTMEEYMDSMQLYKEESYSIYQTFQLPNDPALEEIKKKALHVLAITEDWCGDAMLNNAIMRKIAEATNMELRAVKRDEDTALIDRYLTNGGRAIPIYLFLNNEGEVVGKWGPRAPQLQQYVEEQKNTLPPKETPDFSEIQKNLYTKITKDYTTNEAFWIDVYVSIREALMN